eukprot:106956_1
MSSALQTEVVVSYTVFSVILLLILLFHFWRQRFVKEVDGESMKLFKYLQLWHVSYIIIMLPTLRCILVMTWHFMPSILNNNSCEILIRIDATVWFAIQGFIHLFVAMRTRLNSFDSNNNSNSNSNSNNNGNNATMLFKIAIMLVFLDFFPMFFTLSGSAFDVIHINSTCKPINISLILIIATICSSVIIGLYSLFALVIPLQKYIKIVNKLDSNDKFLRTLVNKIVIYSSTMIISTLTVTFVVAFIKDYVEIVTALDNIINCYCVVLQFRDINTEHIQSKYGTTIISCLQFECIMCRINEKNNNKTFKTSVDMSTTKQSNTIANDTEKYIKTLQLYT